MGNIYHISSEQDWFKALDLGEYRDDSLRDAGFIHCSTFEQVSDTAKRHYAGQKDLLLMEIDDSSLGSAVKYEMAPIGQLFPHVYGPIPVLSVVKVYPLIENPDGEFSWPVG
jgi:uncharacterized protein (DUF952 family)